MSMTPHRCRCRTCFREFGENPYSELWEKVAEAPAEEGLRSQTEEEWQAYMDVVEANSEPIEAEAEALEKIRIYVYQAVGALLDFAGLFNTKQAEDLLDVLSLPWREAQDKLDELLPFTLAFGNGQDVEAALREELDDVENELMELRKHILGQGGGTTEEAVLRINELKRRVRDKERIFF